MFAFLSVLIAWVRARIVAIVRAQTLATLSKSIKVGNLEIVEGTERYAFGPSSGPGAKPPVVLTILNDHFWLRLITATDIGVAEAYMVGEIFLNDLDGFMMLFLDNRPYMESSMTWVQKIVEVLDGLVRTFVGTTPAQSRLNAVAGYDCSNTLFQAFLSKEMMYSCPWWGDAEGGISGDLDPAFGVKPGDLEAAQMRKIHNVIAKARIEKGHRVLEFGSGWGGFCIEAARLTGCSVDTVTLSKEQKKLADERIVAAGLQDRVRVHLMDYRSFPKTFPELKNTFDAFVSIEMLEHVGPTHYEDFFACVQWALKPDVATAVVTSTTKPETRFTIIQPHDFARKYFWPNGSLPSATALVQATNKASKGTLVLHEVMNHGPHYARALREWARRFDANITTEVIEQIEADTPEVKVTDPKLWQTFRRKWMWLFAYANAGYVKGYVTCHMLTFTREENPTSSCFERIVD
ncbi:CFS1-like protein [Punctularia strigosozonata HHB-11173 SS5]|uniref:CFS1-like protein n=1 Tax=Punctularia strigosozonata (strain HHB-11173) TaxID=741275 RepID=UPI0004416345|nr:CFS1-like protein [Punctularia strigosozonata HHB-11173 SS5]EIN08529.1 CFS1-like protein [Punctularia strigosozonata HHB-11173 SS5]